MSAALQSCACPLCGSAESLPTPYGKEHFSLRACADCRLWYMHPRLPEEAMVARYVGDDYFEGGGDGYTSYDAQERSLRRTFRRVLKHMGKAGLTGGELLEVGCGYGFFLDEAADRFTRLHGTEMSRVAARRAAHTGASVHEGGLADLPDDLKVDVVCAFHVIEHIYDPVRFLTEARRFLKPGGWAVLAAPNRESFLRKLLGNRWPSFKYPEHVAYYNRQTLSDLFSRAGFGKVRRIPYLHDFPLGEMVAKFGVPTPGPVAGLPLTIPTTTVCLAGRLEQPVAAGG